MKRIDFNNEQDWLEARRGKITGTKAGSLFSKTTQKPLKGFYEVIAERVALLPSGENAMDRGRRLEEEAIDRFVSETGKKVDKSICIIFRDDNEAIAYSPDGLIGKTEDVEVKCLNSASHIEAWITKEVPKEYMAQIIQGFVVNDKLKTRYMVFYDPRMPRDFFYLTIHRKDYDYEIESALAQQKRALEEIDRIITELTF